MNKSFYSFDAFDFIQILATRLYWTTIFGLWAWIAWEVMSFDNIDVFIFSCFFGVVIGGLLVYCVAPVLVFLSFLIAVLLVGLVKLFQTVKGLL